MNQYIIALLKEINTIIIPGIGALTITNAATGEIMFLPYLKYDDGILVKHISEKEGMSENDARNLLAKYVREIEAQLNIGETYDLFQFGSFSKNKVGEIEFIAWGETKITIESNQAETVIAETTIIENTKEVEPTAIEPKIKEEVIEIKEISAETPALAADRELTEEASISEIIAIEPTIKETIIAANIQEHSIPEKEVEPKYTEADQWEDDLDLPPINAKIERPKKPIIERIKKDKKPKRARFYFLLVFIALIIAGTLTVTMFYNSLENILPFMTSEKTHKKDINTTKKETVGSTGSPQDTKIITKTKVEAEEKVKETIPTPMKIAEQVIEPKLSSDLIQTSTGQVDRNKPFHIIAGAFLNKSYADRYQNRLISEGNMSVIIGQFDKLYFVSIGSYSTDEEAKISIKTARNTSPKAWIFQWP